MNKSQVKGHLRILIGGAAYSAFFPILADIYHSMTSLSTDSVITAKGFFAMVAVAIVHYYSHQAHADADDPIKAPVPPPSSAGFVNRSLMYALGALSLILLFFTVGCSTDSAGQILNKTIASINAGAEAGKIVYDVQWTNKMSILASNDPAAISLLADKQKEAILVQDYQVAERLILNQLSLSLTNSAIPLPDPTPLLLTFTNLTVFYGSHTNK